MNKADNEIRDTKSKLNTLYISMLLKITHFLAKNNLSVKEINPKLIIFLAEEIEELIMKQYLDTCPKNATYDSHEACDSFIESINQYLEKKTQEGIMNTSDIIVFADESMNAARKEMLGIFVSFYNEGDNAFHLDFINLVEYSSKDSESLMDLLKSTLDSRNVDIHRTHFCCLDGSSAMSGEHTGLQRRSRHTDANHDVGGCAFRHKHLEPPFAE